MSATRKQPRLMGDPQILQDLVDRSNSMEHAGQRIGMTGGAVGAALKSGRVTKTVEMAARQALAKMAAKEEQGELDTILLVVVPTEKAEALETVMRAMGVRKVSPIGKAVPE